MYCWKASSFVAAVLWPQIPSKVGSVPVPKELCMESWH